MTLPEVTTPKALAQHLGWPERRVRKIAKALGACLISGDCMVLTHDDILKIMESQRCRSNSIGVAKRGTTGGRSGQSKGGNGLGDLAKQKTKTSQRVRLPRSKPVTGKVILM